jgi:predicted metalloendopeptidase
MNKSKKRGSLKKNITRKNSTHSCNDKCNQIIYQPFQTEYRKHLRYGATETRKIELNYLKLLAAQFKRNAISPKDDYYNYVNKDWLMKKENTGLKKDQGYIVEIDQYRIVQDKVYYELDDIINEYIKDNKTKTSENLKNFYNSALKGVDEQTIKTETKKFIEYYDNLRKDKNNIWELLAYFSKNTVVPTLLPLHLNVSSDLKNCKYNVCYVVPKIFFLTDINVYYDNGKQVEYKKKYREAYGRTVKHMFEDILGKNNGLDHHAIFRTGQEIFNAYGCSSIKEAEDGYNIVTAKEALEKYNFDFNTLCKHMGFTSIPSKFVCTNLNFLKCCSDLLLKEWDSEDWKANWIFLFLRSMARLSYGKLHRDTWSLAGKYSRGLESQADKKVFAVLFSSYSFDKLLTKEYVKRYEDPIIVKYITDLYNDIIKVFQTIVSRSKWTAPSTKASALKKLEKIRFIIGHYPFDEIADDPVIDYGNDFYENMIKLLNWRNNFNNNLVGKHIIEQPMLDWNQTPPKLVGTQAYVVNAAYTPSKNNIFVNLGILQKPFVDISLGLEYNLARMGFTVGHEMSHCLDDFGSKYDADGNLNNWWTPKDKKKYKQIQQGVIKQYEAWAKRDGVIFDASQTIGEDIADISGLANCDEYLRQYLHYNKMIPSQQSAIFKRFHLEFAVQERQKIPKRALSAQLLTNVHPPDVYRCNVPLSRSVIFVTNQDIKPGDGMYWKDNNSVWS